MSGNHPPYKSFIFLLFTCSLSFFPHLFEKSSVTLRCGVGSLIYRNEILFANFFIMIVTLRGDFLQIVWYSSYGELYTMLIFFNP